MEKPAEAIDGPKFPHQSSFLSHSLGFARLSEPSGVMRPGGVKQVARDHTSGGTVKTQTQVSPSRPGALLWP